MSSIDLVILGMLLEKPQSAYDIQKDVEYHHFSRWTKVSAPSIYKKVLQLEQGAYLQSKKMKGSKFAEKAIYFITEKGKRYFEELMERYSSESVSFLFQFNVVVANLNKVEKSKAFVLIEKLRNSIAAGALANEKYAMEFTELPLTGKTIFEQQRLLYRALLEWLDRFEAQLEA